MRTPVFCFLLALAVFPAGFAPAPAAAATRVAPADEYFGHLKMSILGIRNQLRDLETRVTYRGQSRSSLLGKASFLEDAMADWSAKYPADPWIPGFRTRLRLCYVRIAMMR